LFTAEGEAAVLRITTRTNEDGLLLELEGRLSGPWVPELEAAWRAARATDPEASIRVNLCEVDVVDAAGRYLLALMHESGAQLVARGCAMSELLREITGSWPTPVSSGR
jgi:anti-anti-sigma regulatory factor